MAIATGWPGSDVLDVDWGVLTRLLSPAPVRSARNWTSAPGDASSLAAWVERLEEGNRSSGLFWAARFVPPMNIRRHNLHVDQGLAALLGATVGVAGTVAASAISGWSVGQNVRAQAKVDHAQWRRQARRDAYSAFLGPAGEAQDALKLAGRAFIGERDVEEVDRQLRTAQEFLRAVRSARASLAIEGPSSVEQAANGVHTGLQSMNATLLAWQGAPSDASDRNVPFVERHAEEVATSSERLIAFAVAARAALDDIDDEPTGRARRTVPLISRKGSART